MSTKPWTTTLRVTLSCYEGQPGGEDALYSPPGKVLEVVVVADRAFLSLCDYDEDYDTTTTKRIGDAQVDAAALLNALVSQMGIERVRLAIPFPDGAQ